MGAFVSLNGDAIRTVSRFLAPAAILLLLSGASCPPGPGRTYSCGDPTSAHGHCYGIVSFNVTDFGNGLNFGLFSTVVNAVALLGGSVAGTKNPGELNDEFWVTQKRVPTGCVDRDGTQIPCWVEVGLSAGGCSISPNETHLFWADNRPFEGFFCHDLGPLEQQEFGHDTSLLIRQNASDTSTYDVIVITCVDASAQCSGRGFIGESTVNAMFPDDVDMGMELAGTTGANAPGTNFLGTIVTGRNGPKFLDVNGVIRNDMPTTAAWSSLPTSGNGGSFHTSCCF